MAGERHNPKMVSRFEANLLRILQFLLRRDPAGQALELIYANCDPPPCLSRECVELVKDTLAKGCVSILARAGWPRQRFLKSGQVVAGRLWERHTVPELALAFSENTLRFLIWLAARNPAIKNGTWPVLDRTQLAIGDHLFFYLAFGKLRDTEGERFFSSKELFFTNGLCRIAYPDSFVHAARDKRLEFAQWTVGAGAAILEALQPELTERWLEIEKSKAQIGDWEQMQALGRSQEYVLVSFLDAMDRAGRRDLVRFLAAALQALLPDNPRLEWWTGGLRSAGPRIMDRSVTNRAALVLLRLMSRLKGWDHQARAVGYFDEEYAASQLWKSDWESWRGDVLAGRAATLLQQIEPLG
jgi:hypothetical protein